MKKKIDNLALIGGSNDLPLFAFGSIKKKFKKFIYINISINNKKKLPKNRFIYNLKIFELEKCIDLLRSNKITHICFLGSVSRPDLTTFKLDKILSKYMSSLLIASSEGDGSILNNIVNIFKNEGFITKSFIDVFPNQYLLDEEREMLSITEKNDVDKGVSLLKTLSKFDNAQSCAISNGYILAIEAVEGTDKMLSRINSIKKKISRDIVEGVLIKMPKTDQNLKIDLPTVGLNTLQMMYRNKLNVLAVVKDLTIVVEKVNFYKALKKYKIKLHFID